MLKLSHSIGVTSKLGKRNFRLGGILEIFKKNSNFKKNGHFIPNTLIIISISPPRKFTKALDSLQTSLKGLKESFAMIQDTKIEQNHIVFQGLFSEKRDLLEKTLRP